MSISRSIALGALTAAVVALMGALVPQLVSGSIAGYALLVLFGLMVSPFVLLMAARFGSVLTQPDPRRFFQVAAAIAMVGLFHLVNQAAHGAVLASPDSNGVVVGFFAWRFGVVAMFSMAFVLRSWSNSDGASPPRASATGRPTLTLA